MAPVVIAGGGIGGLACALACARAGMGAVVLERSARFGEAGAGIQLAPNAFRAFDAIGVGDAARAMAVHVDALRMMDALTGEPIATIPLGDAFRARFGPYAVVHRGDLHAMLLAACEAAPGVALRTGAGVAGYETDADGATAILEDGGRVEGAALIGADGLWSRVRAAMIGDAVRVSGHTTYRSVIPADAFPEAIRWNAATLWAGPRCHLVHYPLRGGDAFNLVATYHDDAAEPVAGAPAAASDVRRGFAHAAPVVRDVIDRGRDWRLWVLCDREPVADWSDGRVALMGDAAHPTLQYLAQGACMALEDAVALAGHLAGADGDVPAALRAYAAGRGPRTARVQLQSRAVGEHVYHPEGAHAAARDAVMRAKGPHDWYDALDWLYGPGDGASPLAPGKVTTDDRYVT